jgi:uncharacterized protein (DUF2141 family)
MRRLAYLAFLPFLAANGPAPIVLDVEIEGMRNQRGQIHACLTRDPAHFPDCRKDPSALRQSVAATSHHVQFSGFPPGTYALTILHDENSNGRMDKVVGVPKEGFGFSKNPTVRFAPPSFDRVRMPLKHGHTDAKVRIQYVL